MPMVQDGKQRALETSSSTKFFDYSSLGSPSDCHPPGPEPAASINGDGAI